MYKKLLISAYLHICIYGKGHFNPGLYVYNELSKRKDSKSLSKVLRDLLASSESETVLGDLKKYHGILPEEIAHEMNIELQRGGARDMARNLKES